MTTTDATVDVRTGIPELLLCDQVINRRLREVLDE